MTLWCHLRKRKDKGYKEILRAYFSYNFHFSYFSYNFHFHIMMSFKKKKG